MSFAGPSKTCPRCNTVLPAQATFCGTCGWQFAASTPSAPPAGYAPTQYTPNQPGSFPPPAQPGYPPPGGPGSFPPAQPGGFSNYGAPAQAPYPGAPPYPGAFAPPPKKRGAGGVIILVLVLVVLLGGGAAAWFLYLSPSSPNSPLFDRHGLQSNVPLLNGSTFKQKKSFSETDSGTTVSADAWIWTVGGSDPTAVQQFYKDNLGKNGWTKIKTDTGENGEKEVLACQGGQILIVVASTKLEITDENGKVTDTIDGPSGGSAYATELSSTPVLVQLLCSNTPVLPTP